MDLSPAPWGVLLPPIPRGAHGVRAIVRRVHGDHGVQVHEADSVHGVRGVQALKFCTEPRSPFTKWRCGEPFGEKKCEVGPVWLSPPLTHLLHTQPRLLTRAAG